MSIMSSIGLPRESWYALAMTVLSMSSSTPFARDPVWQLDVAVLPDQANVVPPAFEHAGDVGVRAAQEQHLGPQRVAARQHRQVLLDDRLEQACHELVRRDALLLQAVDVGV